jgi:hypothetical protein
MKKMNLFSLIFISFFFHSILSTPPELSLSILSINSSSIMNSNYSPYYAIDHSDTTQWISGTCRSGGWKFNSKLNLLTDICLKGLCSASCDQSLRQSNDLSVYTATTIPISHSEGRSWVRYDFPTGPINNLTSIYIRGSWAVNTSLYGILPTGDLTHLTSLNPLLSYQDINLFGPFPLSPLIGLYLQASSLDPTMTGFCYANVGDCQSFSVTEIAVLVGQCDEELLIDLGMNKRLLSYRAKYSGFEQLVIETSIDGLTYIPRMTLGSASSSSSQGTTQVSFPNNIVGRYVKFR